MYIIIYLQCTNYVHAMYINSNVHSIVMYMQCTYNNNSSHDVHFDFFIVSQMYVPMYIKCSSQIDLMYINSDVHEMYIK